MFEHGFCVKYKEAVIDFFEIIYPCRWKESENSQSLSVVVTAALAEISNRDVPNTKQYGQLECDFRFWNTTWPLASKFTYNCDSDTYFLFSPFLNYIYSSVMVIWMRTSKEYRGSGCGLFMGPVSAFSLMR
jgi:hypothetical protein